MADEKQNIIASIDTETTGLFPYWNEMIQLAIVPLDNNFKPSQKLKPLVIEAKPNFPERWSDGAAKVNGLKEKSLNFAKKEEGVQKLINWLDTNNIIITPLAQNWMFDKFFIEEFLGKDGKKKIMEKYFTKNYRDLKIAAQFLDDMCLQYKGRVRFTNFSLKYFCEQYNISYEGAHDATVDALNTAKCYREFIKSVKKLMDVSQPLQD